MVNNANLFFIILVGAVVAAASAYIGSLMVLKRMSLVGDALSHVALPGMAIALSLGISPIIGAFLALCLAILGIWYLEETSDTYPEALVGIFFTASLAIGLLLTHDTELLEALFGNIEKINFLEGFASILISIGVITGLTIIHKKILTLIISPELAMTSGIRTKWINLLYLLLVGIIVSLGIRFVGTLLMGALVIVPAVSARNITSSMKGYVVFSIVFGIVSAVAGILMAQYSGSPVGAMVVLTSIGLYLISYLSKMILHHV